MGSVFLHPGDTDRSAYAALNVLSFHPEREDMCPFLSSIAPEATAPGTLWNSFSFQAFVLDSLSLLYLQFDGNSQNPVWFL